MIGSQERSALIKSIVAVMRELVAPLHATIQSLREEFELKIRAIPEGKPGRDADPAPIEQIVAEVVRQIPAPKDGADGANGRDGTDGKDGRDGENGAPGERGEKGEWGIPGERGERGESGLAGERGPIGERGENGTPGERGERGEPGPAGEIGPAGERGIDGVSITGPKGDSGPAGERGEKGERGERGETGARGLPGEAGRDALQTEILPGVDESKRFPRGTFARYQNGLIRSFRETDPLTAGGEIEKCGWEVIVAGVARLVIVQGEDSRSFEVRSMLTGGADMSERFQIPSMIYRGVRQSDVDYAHGDTVTWNGSVWHCEVETTRAVPGTSNDWKLAVKHGERGKDLRATPEPPKPGPVTLK